MAADFETWLMRGSVVGLLGLVIKLGTDRWRDQDRKALALEQSLATARVELYEAMDKWTNRFSESIETLNLGVARLAGVVTDFQLKVAEARYITNDDFRELKSCIADDFREIKADIAEDMRKCAANCPLKNGRGVNQ